MKNLWRIGRAFSMAAWGHRNQRDKAGKRYIWHVVRVAWIAYGLKPCAKVVIVGLLHDYIEDVDKTAVGKILQRFDWPTAIAVQDLTRDCDTTYANYIRHVLIFASEDAQVVKLADLLDNTQPGRIPRPPQDNGLGAQLMRVMAAGDHRGAKYLDAIEALTRQRVMRSWGVE